MKKKEVEDGRALVNKGETDVASRGLVNKGDMASNADKLKKWNEEQNMKKKKYQYLPTDKKGFVNEVEIA